MDKIIVNSGSFPIQMIKKSLYDYLWELSFQKQFLVYHVKEKEFEKLEEELYRGNLTSFLLDAFHSYMLTNNIKEKCYKMSDYRYPDKRMNYIVTNGRMKLVSGKSFIHDSISYQYARGTHIYTTETYEDVVQYFQRRTEIYDEIIKELDEWDEVKKEIFNELFYPQQDGYFKKFLEEQKQLIKQK